MDTLYLQIRRAQRRLLSQHLLWSLSWCWFTAGALFAVAVVVVKLQAGDGPWEQLAGGAALLGMLAAVTWTYLARRSTLDVAYEIDRRCGLRERLSSSLSLTSTERESPAGEALIQDAVYRLERLEIAPQFPIRLGRWVCLPLMPILLAIGLVMLWQPAVSPSLAGALETAAQQTLQIKKSTEAVRKQLEQRKQQAEERGLTEAEALFARLEREAREMSSQPSADRKDALVRLNDLAKELEQRRQGAAGAEQLRQQLEQLKDMQRGPADKAIEAMQQGDLKQAAHELNTLREQLAAGKMDRAQQEQLARQVEQLQQKLQQALDAQQQAKQELERRLAEAQQAGRQDEAEQLRQQLDKLEQKIAQHEHLKSLANPLGQLAKSLRQGEAKQAAEQLGQLADQLSQMNEQLDEAPLLSDALDQIAQAKDSMHCKECLGQGCTHCQARGQRAGRGEGNVQGDGNGQGDGIGRGQGKGFRPEQAVPDANYSSRAKQRVGQGSALVSGTADGPNAKGRVQQTIQEEWQSVAGDKSDPLANQPLPREYRQHAKKYFDSLRSGK